MALHTYLKMESVCLVQLQQLYPQVKNKEVCEMTFMSSSFIFMKNVQQTFTVNHYPAALFLKDICRSQSYFSELVF